MRSKNKWAIFLFLVGFSVAFRFLSFLPSVIDHDESTYLVIADGLLKGKTLYVDLVDIKPVGIFLIFAAFQALLGKSVFMIRLLTAVVIGLSAYIIYLFKYTQYKNRNVAFASGIIYILLLSMYTFYGVAVNTELFFNFFTIGGLYLLHKRQNTSGYILFGLMLGIGFIIKIVVMFDFAAIMMFFLILQLRKEKEIRFHQLTKPLIAFAFFILPYGLVNIYYLIIDHYDAFYFINFDVFRSYPVKREFNRTIIYILNFHGRYLPVTYLFYRMIFERKYKDHIFQNERLLVIIWSVFVLSAILLPGKTFGHYFIQFTLPVSIFAGNYFLPDIRKKFWVDYIFKKPYIYGIFAVIILLNFYFQKKDYLDKKDVVQEVAGYIEKRLEPGDIIYTGNYHHIIYYLLDSESPTKYIHRSLLTTDSHIRALQLDPDKEFRRIMSENPRFVIVKKEHPNEVFNEFLNKKYRLIKTFKENSKGDVKIYERKDFLHGK